MANYPLVITSSGGLKELPLVTTIGATGSDSAIPTEQAVREAISDSSIPTGTIWMTALRIAPTGWLLLGNGEAVSRSTYANLFEAIVPNLGTVAVSIASPAVISLTGHGLAVGETFYFTTTGALPTGMTANTLYRVMADGYGANAFQFSASLGGAAVTTSGSQSGTHTLRACPYGLGDGSTTFNLPSVAGRSPMGAGTGSGLTARTLGATLGEEGHALMANENGTHNHLINCSSFAGSLPGVYGGGYADTGLNQGPSDGRTKSSGLGTPHNTVHPVFVTNYIIKT